jgi:hypothetical protein
MHIQQYIIFLFWDMYINNCLCWICASHQRSRYLLPPIHVSYITYCTLRNVYMQISCCLHHVNTNTVIGLLSERTPGRNYQCHACVHSSDLCSNTTEIIQYTKSTQNWSNCLEFIGKVMLLLDLVPDKNCLQRHRLSWDLLGKIGIVPPRGTG